MKREVLCLPCQRLLLGKLHGEPGEQHKWVRGALVLSCVCDHCNAPLLPGDEAVALSIWRTNGVSGGYYPWEHEFFALGSAVVDGAGGDGPGEVAACG